MRNEALCQSLYEKGYQLYLKMYQDLNAELNLDRPEMDEGYYQSMPLPQLTRLAKKGDTAAQFCLADYYASNDQMNLAMEWFQRSADGGCADAMEMLGAIYTNGTDGVKCDRTKALMWLKKAAKTGCTSFTVKLICDFYLDQDSPTYKDYEDALPWVMQYSAYMQDGTEDAQNEVLRIIAILQVLIEVNLEDAYWDPVYADYQETENDALLCYYWQGVAQSLEVSSDDPYAVKTADILCQIGECAYRMKKPYGKETLKEAMHMGSDYAAVLLVPEAIDKAWDVKSTPMGPTFYTVVDYQIFASNPIGPNQIKAANSWVQDYFPGVRSAATSQMYRGSYRQAEALYRLSHFYVFGLCCRRDLNAAHHYLEQAANLGHTPAKNLLGHFHRKFPFGWEVR